MIFENLTDDECALFALCMDESGLDLAEFCYIDEQEDEHGFSDGCFRAWPFQYAWWRLNDQKTIDAGSRSCGKSMSIRFRAFAFPFINPGEEMVITAPEANHLDAVTGNIETLYTNNRFASELLTGGRSGIKHRPFQMNFSNGCRIMGRIPQLDGSGVKGIHPIWLEHDEASDYPEKGWSELVSTVKFNSPKGRWRAHGVTRGVGDSFDEKISDENSTWKITRLPAMYRPDWTDDERAQKIEQFHGYDSDGYRRNVLGSPGDGNSPMFVLTRIMQNVTIDLADPHNALEYYTTFISEAMVREVDTIEDLIEIPAVQISKYKNFWIGMDFGWTISPSAIVVFAEERDPKKAQTSMKLVSKILLKGISPDDQMKVIMSLMETYRPIAYALDATGAGQPVVKMLELKVKENPEIAYMLDRIRPYNFGEKIIVDFDQSIKINEHETDGFMAAAIKRPFLEASADFLRVLIDSGRMPIPYDKLLINELQSTPKNTRSIPDAYGKSTHRKTGQHVLDAMRMAVTAQQTHHIQEFIATHEEVWVAPKMILF